jgi:hypothetical protein
MIHHSLCGYQGFGPIDSNVSDFTLCFQTLIIDSIPLLIFVISAIDHVLDFMSTERIEYPSPMHSWTRRFKAQIQVSIALSIVPIIVLILRLVFSGHDGRPFSAFPYVTLSSLIQSIAWACNTWLLLMLRRHEISVTKGIEWWWILSFLAAIKDIESSFIRTIYVRFAAI